MDALSTQVDETSVNQQIPGVETIAPEEAVINTLPPPPPYLPVPPPYLSTTASQNLNFALIQFEIERFNVLFSQDAEAGIAARKYALSMPSLTRALMNFQLILNGMSQEDIIEQMSVFDQAYAAQRQLNPDLTAQDALQQALQFEVKQQVNFPPPLLEPVAEEDFKFEADQLAAAIELVNAEAAQLNQEQFILAGNVLVEDEDTDEEEEDEEFSYSNDESDSVVDPQQIIAAEISAVVTEEVAFVADAPVEEVAAVVTEEVVVVADASVEEVAAVVTEEVVVVADAPVEEVAAVVTEEVAVVADASEELASELLVNSGSPMLNAYNNIVDSASTNLALVIESDQVQAEETYQQDHSAPSLAL